MEPIEWLTLGVGLVIGGLFGAKGKGVVKSAAKGYLVIGEKAQEWTANIREDLKDAIEEARYEKEQEDALHHEEAVGAVHANGTSSSNSIKHEHTDGPSEHTKSPRATD